MSKGVKIVSRTRKQQSGNRGMVHYNWTVTNVPVTYIIILMITKWYRRYNQTRFVRPKMKMKNTVKFTCVTFRENNINVTIRLFQISSQLNDRHCNLDHSTTVITVLIIGPIVLKSYNLLQLNLSKTGRSG